MRRALRPILILPLFVSAVACESSDPAAESNAAGDEAATVRPTAAPGQPASIFPDSVVAWAEEIRAGIAVLPGRVADDPDGARQRAVELYVTRQERIEQASGPGTGSPADLAESVHEAEVRFHELMELLGETPPPDSTAVRGAVQALDTRLTEVVELAAGAAPGDPR